MRACLLTTKSCHRGKVDGFDFLWEKVMVIELFVQIFFLLNVEKLQPNKAVYVVYNF
jgi:hypothetical protein